MRSRRPPAALRLKEVRHADLVGDMLKLFFDVVSLVRFVRLNGDRSSGEQQLDPGYQRGGTLEKPDGGLRFLLLQPGIALTAATEPIVHVPYILRDLGEILLEGFVI